MLRLSLLASIFCVSTCAQSEAYTLRFQPTLEVWKCPPGATYIITQCAPVLQKAMPKVSLKLDAYGNSDPVYSAEWSQSSTATGAPQSFYSLDALRYHDHQGRPFLSLTASAGFDANSARDGSLYLRMSTDSVPTTLMVTSDRVTEGDHEIVTDFELNDLTFTK